MRDDMKIGILLGFLVLVGIMTYWLTHRQADAPVQSGQQVGVINAQAGTGSATAPAPATTHTASLSGVGAPLAGTTDEPAPIRRTAPAAAPTLDADEPLVHVDAPPPVVGGTGSTTIPATGTGTAAAGGVTPPVVLGTGPTAATVGGTAAWVALESAADGGKVYKTQSGDSAWLLAQKFYGNGAKMNLITEANKDVDFKNLKVGATIKLPAMPAPVAAGTTAGGLTAAVPLAADEYVIKPGDSLSKIAAEKYGKEGLWKKILDANPGLDEHNLKPGQKIKVPAVPPVVPVTGGPVDATSGTPGAPAAANTYRVKKGDTLWTIAESQLGSGIKGKAIYELNKAKIGADPNDLKEGMVLELPGKADTPKVGDAPKVAPKDAAKATPKDTHKDAPKPKTPEDDFGPSPLL